MLAYVRPNPKKRDPEKMFQVAEYLKLISLERKKAANKAIPSPKREAVYKVILELENRLRVYAEKNKDEFTRNGQRTVIHLGEGTFGWREGRFFYETANRFNYLKGARQIKGPK